MPLYEVLGTNKQLVSIIVDAESAEQAELLASDIDIDTWSIDDVELEINFGYTELAN